MSFPERDSPRLVVNNCDSVGPEPGLQFSSSKKLYSGDSPQHHHHHHHHHHSRNSSNSSSPRAPSEPSSPTTSEPSSPTTSAKSSPRPISTRHSPRTAGLHSSPPGNQESPLTKRRVTIYPREEEKNSESSRVHSLSAEDRANRKRCCSTNSYLKVSTTESQTTLLAEEKLSQIPSQEAITSTFPPITTTTTSTTVYTTTTTTKPSAVTSASPRALSDISTVPLLPESMGAVAGAVVTRALIKPRSKSLVHDLSIHLSPRSLMEHRLKPRQAPKSQNIEEAEFIELSKIREGKHFDVIGLLESWNKVSNKPDVNAEKLENSIYLICRQHINALKKFKKIKDADALSRQVIKSVPFLLDSIQSNTHLLRDISERIKIFHEIVKRGHKKKESLWSERLLKYLTLLSRIDQLKDGAFWSQFNDFQLKENEKVYSIILKAFGDSSLEIERVLKTIQVWSEIPKNIVIDPLKPTVSSEVGDRLDVHIKKACNEIMSVEKDLFKEHVFPLQLGDIKILLEIPLEHIKRSIQPGNIVLYNSIIINGEVFYLATDRLNNEGIDPVCFWTDLFKALYMAQQMNFSDEEIAAQIELFMLESDPDFKRSFKKMYPERQIPSSEEIEKLIPCLPILKLMTNNGRLRGDHYVKGLFAPIAMRPYGLKPRQGIECSVTIKSDGYKVTQRMAYNVCRVADPNNLTSLFPSLDLDHPLAQIPLSWTIENFHKWIGRIQILNPDSCQCQDSSLFKILPFATEEERWFILKTLSNRTTTRLRLFAPGEALNDVPIEIIMKGRRKEKVCMSVDNSLHPAPSKIKPQEAIRSDTPLFTRLCSLQKGSHLSPVTDTDEVPAQALYLESLVNQRHIFAALEKALTKHRLNPLFGSLYIPELFRTEQIDQDLRAFGIEEYLPPSERTEEYAEHIEKISNERPGLLSAHVYANFKVHIDSGELMFSMLSKWYGPNKNQTYQYSDLFEKYAISSVGDFEPILEGLLNHLELFPDECGAIAAEYESILTKWVL